MKRTILSIYTLLATGLLLLVASCKFDQVNPNAAGDDEVLTTRDGIIALSIGIRQYYSTTGIEATMQYVGVTSRELKGVGTTTTASELEAGGVNLPTNNTAILAYWSRMQHLLGMCDNVINNAPRVTAIESDMLSGIMGQAYLFKAVALAELAMAFEQSNIVTSTTIPVTFLPRAQVLAEAVRMINLGVTAVTTTAPSALFTTSVTGSDFNLKNTLYAYGARYNLIAGNYQVAKDLADKVDLTVASKFTYTTLSANPMYTIFGITKYYRSRKHFGLPTGMYEANDGRLGFYFSAAADVVVTGDTTTTITGFTTSQTGAIPVYLPDEVKLVQAECILRLDGSLTDAKTLIDAVRTQTTGDLFGVNAALPAYSGAVTKDALLLEVYKQRCAELYMSGLKWEDTRRFGRPVPPSNVTERNRVYYPYPSQERLNNVNTPADPAI